MNIDVAKKDSTCQVVLYQDKMYIDVAKKVGPI